MPLGSLLEVAVLEVLESLLEVLGSLLQVLTSHIEALGSLFEVLGSLFEAPQLDCGPPWIEVGGPGIDFGDSYRLYKQRLKWIQLGKLLGLTLFEFPKVVKNCKSVIGKGVCSRFEIIASSEYFFHRYVDCRSKPQRWQK